MEVVSERHPRVPIWNPSLELDGAYSRWILPLGISKREKRAMWSTLWSNPLLLPQDMADLRTLKKHEVFLTLKRDLAMVHPSIYFMNHTHMYFILLDYFSHYYYLLGNPNNQHR